MVKVRKPKLREDAEKSRVETVHRYSARTNEYRTRGKRDQEKTMKSPEIIAVLDRRRMDGASSFCQILCKSTI